MKKLMGCYHLDSGTWVRAENDLIEQADISHPSFALQFPFHTIRTLERQEPDFNKYYHCPLCYDVSPGIKSSIVEHIMATHVTLNVHKFIEKLFWYNQDGRLIKEKFGITEEQMKEVRKIGAHARRMEGLLGKACDSLRHAQKAKVTLGTEILDMVASRSRQQALFDIIKNGCSEADAIHEARIDCRRYEMDSPDCTFIPSHLESIHVRKSPKGGASPVKIDVFIEGTSKASGAVTYTEIREIRAKAVKKGCATPVAKMICGEASAVLLKKGLVSKFVISCDMNVPFWNNLATRQLSTSFRILKLDNSWRSLIDIETRHRDGYATSLADGTHVWTHFAKGNGPLYSVRIEIWKPGNAGHNSAGLVPDVPDCTSAFTLEFRQLPKPIGAYNALAEQMVTITCGLCGMKRWPEPGKKASCRHFIEQEAWYPAYKEFEEFLASVDGVLVTPLDDTRARHGRVDRDVAPPGVARDRAVFEANSRARILGNQWSIKLILRMWPTCLEALGSSPAQARAEMERAFRATGTDPRTAVAHLNTTRAREILNNLQSAQSGGGKGIILEIISMLKEQYVPTYFNTPYMPFTQRMGDKTTLSPITPTQEVLIGLETIAFEALGLARRGIKVGKIKRGGVEKHWNALHRMLVCEPNAVSVVCSALDRLLID